MLSLIWRDLYVYQKKNFASMLFTILIYVFVYKVWQIGDGFALAVTLVFMSFYNMSIATSFTMDEIYKFNRYLVAMPIKKHEIVLSRLCSSCFVGFLGIVAFLALSGVVFGFQHLQIFDFTINVRTNGFLLILCFCSLNCYCAFVLFLRFWLKPNKYGIIYSILYIISFIFVSVLTSNAMIVFLNTMIMGTAFLGLVYGSVAVVISFAILLFAILFSKKAVDKKDF